MTANPLSTNSEQFQTRNKYLDSEEWESIGFFSEKRNDTVGFAAPTYLILENKINFNTHNLGEEILNFTNNFSEYFRIIFISENILNIKKLIDHETYLDQYDTYEIFVKKEILIPVCQAISELIENDFDLEKARNL